MKNGIKFLVVSLVLLTSVAFANASNPESALRDAIVELVKEEVMDVLPSHTSADIKLQFEFTAEGAIHVIAVDCENKEVARVIQENLNNSKVGVEEYITNIPYRLKMNFYNEK